MTKYVRLRDNGYSLLATLFLLFTITAAITAVSSILATASTENNNSNYRLRMDNALTSAATLSIDYQRTHPDAGWTGTYDAQDDCLGNGPPEPEITINGIDLRSWCVNSNYSANNLQRQMSMVICPASIDQYLCLKSPNFSASVLYTDAIEEPVTVALFSNSIATYANGVVSSFIVQATNPQGIPIAGVPVAPVLSSTTATLLSPVAITNSAGKATFQLTDTIQETGVTLINNPYVQPLDCNDTNCIGIDWCGTISSTGASAACVTTGGPGTNNAAHIECTTTCGLHEQIQSWVLHE